MYFYFLELSTPQRTHKRQRGKFQILESRQHERRCTRKFLFICMNDFVINISNVSVFWRKTKFLFEKRHFSHKAKYSGKGRSSQGDTGQQRGINMLGLLPQRRVPSRTKRPMLRCKGPSIPGIEDVLEADPLSQGIGTPCGRIVLNSFHKLALQQQASP